MAQGAFPALNVKVPQVQQPQTSPLQTLGQYAQLQNLLIGNQQNQQTLDARQAIGQAYRQSIDPQTGQLNTQALLANVAQNPKAAYLAGDVAAAAQTRQNQQLTNQGLQLDQALKRANYASTELGSLIPLGDSITRQQVYAKIGDAINNGIQSPQEAAAFSASMPQTDGPALAQWVKQQYGTVLANQQYLQGQIQGISTGGQTSLIQTSPLTGKASQIGALNNTLSPSEATAPTQIGTDPQTGQPIMGTRQQFVNAAQPAGPFGNGRYPTPGANATPGGGIAMGLPVGQQPAMEEEGKFSAQQYNEIAQNAANVPANKALLQNMAGDLQSFASGPGNVEWRTAVASINRAFGTNIDAKGVASAENFAKLGNQIALAQAGQMGAGTNEKLEASMQANPNPHLSVPGNQQIIHVLLGNQDAIGAWNQAAQSYQQANGPASYQKFVADTSKYFDPRAFQMQQMTPEERASTWSAMTPAEQNQFKADVQKMSDAGMFSQVGEAQPTAAAAPAAAVVPAAVPIGTPPSVPTAQ
jgi:hypothetical protein